MDSISQLIHDARRPLNSISMQAELVKMLVEAYPDNQPILAAANKIIENAKQCSEQLQVISDTAAPSP